MPPAPNDNRERIPVALPRPAPVANVTVQRAYVDGSGAGVTILVVIGVVTTLGALVGQQMSLGVSGGLIGCFFGVVAGFAATYVRHRGI